MKRYLEPPPGTKFMLGCATGFPTCHSPIGPFDTDEDCSEAADELGWELSRFVDDGRIATGCCPYCVAHKQGPSYQKWL